MFSWRLLLIRGNFLFRFYELSFFDILNAVTQKYKGDIQDPYELAVATYIGKNPGKLIYTVSRDDKKTNVIINKTKELKNWAIENQDIIKTYGESAFIFAPNTGDFDVSTYAWLEGAGLLGNKDLETKWMCGSNLKIWKESGMLTSTSLKTGLSKTINFYKNETPNND